MTSKQISVELLLRDQEVAEAYATDKLTRTSSHGLLKSVWDQCEHLLGDVSASKIPDNVRVDALRGKDHEHVVVDGEPLIRNNRTGEMTENCPLCKELSEHGLAQAGTWAVPAWGMGWSMLEHGLSQPGTCVVPGWNMDWSNLGHELFQPGICAVPGWNMDWPNLGHGLSQPGTWAGPGWDMGWSNLEHWLSQPGTCAVPGSDMDWPNLEHGLFQTWKMCCSRLGRGLVQPGWNMGCSSPGHGLIQAGTWIGPTWTMCWPSLGHGSLNPWGQQRVAHGSRGVLFMSKDRNKSPPEGGEEVVGRFDTLNHSSPEGWWD